MKEEIIKFALEHKQFKASDIVTELHVSRQFVARVLREMVLANKLLKVGSTRSAFYVHRDHTEVFSKTQFKRKLKNTKLEEHMVLDNFVRQNPLFSVLKDNLKSIYEYAFSEMMNNAIDHSLSKYIEVSMGADDATLVFSINDNGIGVFKNIMKSRKLKSEMEAIQDLLKGKTTTMPHMHSGEGIFFTSKISDKFILESFGYRLIIDNIIDDIFVEEIKPKKKGTKVSFYITKNSKKHLNDIFDKFRVNEEEPAFDKTEVRIKLYIQGTIYMSRSQARRILVGLDKFAMIVLDFNKVPTVGQAFADEIFRIFAKAHKNIKLEPINMNKAVEFMVERAKKSNVE